MDEYSYSCEMQGLDSINTEFCKGYLNIKGLSNEDLASEIIRTRDVVSATYELEIRLESTLEGHKNCIKEPKLREELINCKLEREIVMLRFKKLQEEYAKRLKKGRILNVF